MVVMSASRCSCAKQKITNRVHARKVFNGMSLRRRLLFFACVSAVAVRVAAQMHPREFTTTVVARADENLAELQSLEGAIPTRGGRCGGEYPSGRIHQEVDVPVNAVSLRLGVMDELARHLGTVELPLPLKTPADESDDRGRRLPPVGPD